MKYIAAGLLVIVSSISNACPVLDGNWSSSREKFIDFNQTWANVEPNAWQFLLQNQGLEIIEYKANNHMVINTPEVELTMGDKKITSSASTENINFNVLGCTENSVVIAYERYGQVQISQLHFEDKDTYWMYMGEAGRSGNGHIREYYTRVK